MGAVFARIGLRHLAAHGLRTALTVGGVALGVAAMIGIRLVSESASDSFRQSVERLAGKAVLQVTNGTAGVAEGLVEAVKAVPGVGAVAPSVQEFVAVPDLPGERLYVFGIDLLGDSELRDYESGAVDGSIEDPLVFLNQPDSVALTTSFLARHGLTEGSRLRVRAGAVEAELTVRATLDVRSGPATLFDGRLAVMDVYAAQSLFALEGRITQIDLGLADGAGIDDVEARVRELVGGRGVVERPLTRGATFEKLVAGNELALASGGFLAVIVGLYLIFNTMTIAVAQRRREIGILRATGMRRVEVLRLIVAESLVLGAAGCAAGVPLGLWLARALAGAYMASVTSRFFPIDPAPIVLAPGPVLGSVALGLGSSFLASLLPAREAVRLQPIETIRPASPTPKLPAAYRRAALSGVALFACVMAIWLAPQAFPLSPNTNGIVTQLGLIASLSLLAPSLLRIVALRLEAALGFGTAPLLSIAARSLVAHIARMAITSSTLVVSLAGAVSIATLISSMERTLGRWVDVNFTGIDLTIGAATGIGPFDWAPIPEELAGEIGALPEIAAISTDRWGVISFEGLPTRLVARDFRPYRTGRRQIDLVEGDREVALEAVARGEAVIVSEVFARRYGRALGDVVSLTSPQGEVRLPIAGISFDINDLGMILVDRGLYRSIWRDRTVTGISTALRPGTDPARVIETIRSRWGEKHGLFVLTSAELRKENEAVLAQSVAAAYPLAAIIILIALLGVVNSLLASVLDRVREIGSLR
ncbi:MAG: FtsX-like permease family protein, partial [Candidatus Binatia bacterium]